MDGLVRSFDKEAVEAFNFLAAKFDDPKIVVSSTWRVGGTKETMGKILSENGISIPVIGITSIDRADGRRSTEIYRWLERSETTEDWIVIDDDWVGLQEIHADKFLYIPGGWEEGGLNKQIVDTFLSRRSG